MHLQAGAGIGVLLLAVIGMTAPAMALGTGRIQVGQPFPELVLPRIDDGEPLSLASYRGRKVVLHVFASW